MAEFDVWLEGSIQLQYGKFDSTFARYALKVNRK